MAKNKLSVPRKKVINNQKSKFKKKLSKSKKSTKDIHDSEKNVENLMDKDFEGSESEDVDLDEELKNSVHSSSSDTETNNISDTEKNYSDDINDASEIEEDSDEDAFLEHKKSLNKLKDTDPEFYKFLQENDKKLLQFNLSDEEGSDVEEVDDAVEDGDEVHKPSSKLEVASDESDFEGDDDDIQEVKDEHIITLKLLKKWQSDIYTDKSNKTITALTRAFHAALRRVSSGEDDDTCHYKVDGSSVFNAVIQLCVLELGPAIRRFLGLSQGSKQPPHKCKKFVKVKNILKGYFMDLLKLLGGVTSANIQTVLLKHLHYMSSLLVSFPNVTKLLIKRLITLWGTADDGVRVIAFFCILRITNNNQVTLLDTVIKSMYLTYVKNCKFVSLGNLAAINFMRRSLVEMFALDVSAAYQHVFLYIRQLAIHLRNAITVVKTENIQTVYNWQFVNSLKLWGNLLSVTCNKPQLQQLIYPLVQVCLGTLKLVPTAQYYPLRFHVVQILIDLSSDTGVYIPILPFLLEVLSSYDFNKKHQKVSMKPLHFTCLLRLSKSQLSENGFKDTVIDTIYGQLLEYLSNQSHTIGFPDLSLVCLLQLKQFVKKCKNASYNRKIKQVIEKIEQNTLFIENERKKLTLNITDNKQIEGWEQQMKNKDPPLSVFYENWNKVRTIKRNKQLTNNDALADYKLPTLKKHKKTDESKKDHGPLVLFPSDSEDDMDVEDEDDKKPRRGKRAGKNVNKKFIDSGPVEDNGISDIVQDFKISDW